MKVFIYQQLRHVCTGEPTSD